MDLPTIDWYQDMNFVRQEIYIGGQEMDQTMNKELHQGGKEKDKRKDESRIGQIHKSKRRQERKRKNTIRRQLPPKPI